MGHCLPDRRYYLSSSVVPNVYGWIEVDGKPLEIFGATEKENKVIGYVEAKEGQRFIVRYADRRVVRPEKDYLMDLYIDGTFAQGFTHSRDHRSFVSPLNDGARYAKLTGCQDSDTTEQPFLFSKLKTTDSDELACTDEQVVKNLGTIQLRYHRIENFRSSTEPDNYGVAETKAIHEKAKKAQLSHQASYGESVQVAKRSWSTFDYIDDKSSPYFQLEFRYRSRQLLQLEGHIPNSPTPSPGPGPSVSPDATPSSPGPSAATARRSASAGRNSQTPQVENDEAARLARLQSELDFLRRQQQIATLEREINDLRSSTGSSGCGAGGVSASARKIKAEPSDVQRDAKKVKRAIGEASLSQSTGGSKGKGKEKKKAEVIVLSDSD